MSRKNIVLKIIDIILAIAIVAIISVVTLQILGRTPLLTKAPHWTEELSRMIFVFIICVGSIAATLRKEFVSVDLLTSRLKGKPAIIFNASLEILLSVFFFSLIPACLKFIELGSRQLSPSLRINMKYLHVFILVSIVGMGLGNLYRAFLNIKDLKGYSPKEGGHSNE